jgi:DNA-binding beta-propeller fold protein YncE
MRRTVVVSVAAVAVIVTAVPASADEEIARPACLPSGSGMPFSCTGVGAYRGRVAWSEYDSAVGRYFLVTRAAGVSVRAPVPPRARPFDADVGPDVRGRPVVLYSRCAGDPGGPATGCGVRELDPATGAERRALIGVTAPVELRPSRWRRRVAVSRRDGHGLRRPYLCTEAATVTRCEARPAGPRGDRPLEPATGPFGIDLGPRTLAVAWLSDDGGLRRRAILVDDLRVPMRRARARSVAQATAGIEEGAVFSPSVSGSSVYYGRGNASCFDAGRAAFGRFDLRRGRTQEVRGFKVVGVARDGAATYYVRCAPLVSGPSPVPDSAIVMRADPDPFLRQRAVGARPSAASMAPGARGGWGQSTLALSGALVGRLRELAGRAGCVADRGAQGCAPGRGLDGAQAVAVSPDGRNVYVASTNAFPAAGSVGDSVAVFRRSRRRGRLEQLAGPAGCVNLSGAGGCARGRALKVVWSVAVSPDGHNVYVTAAGARGGVSVFTRDAATGALTQLPGLAGCVSAATDPTPGCAVARGLANEYAIDFSLDGRFAYVASQATDLGAGGVAAFSRDPLTGALTQLPGTAGCASGSAVEGCAPMRGLTDGAGALAVSPDGVTVYATEPDDSPSAAVAVLARNIDTGSLSQLAGRDGCLNESGRRGCAVARGIKGSVAPTVSPDGRHVYVAGDGISVFERVASTGALRQSKRPKRVPGTSAT